MSKKAILKVVAAICVMSLCFAAVFTGAVSAAESATCTVTGYSYTEGASEVYVTYEVNFHSSAAFVAGSFEITAHDNQRFADCVAKTSSVDGYTPNVYLNVENNKVLFAGFSETSTNDITPFTDLTLLLKFTPTDTGTLKNASKGTTWSITVGNIAITNASEATYTCAQASGTAHIHNFTGATTANGITTSTCNVGTCKATHKEIAPTGTTGIGSNNLVSAGNNKATLQFTSDGDTVLVALVPTSTLNTLGGTTYFVYNFKDDDASLKTATVEQDGTVTIGGTNYTKFPCGRNGGIGRMARDITGNFINVKSGTTTISSVWNYSIAAYAKTVADDNTQDAKDRNYCKALYNYGYYTTKRLNTQTGSFAEDLAKYSTPYTGLADYSLPSKTKADSSGTDTSWRVTGIKVETGYKPKMHIKVDNGGSITVAAYSTAGDLVYKKTVTAANDTYFIISDIPAKYLTGTVEITKSSSNRVITYAFERYAQAMQSASGGQAEVFLWMMKYAYYLNAKFA